MDSSSLRPRGPARRALLKHAATAGLDDCRRRKTSPAEGPFAERSSADARAPGRPLKAQSWLAHMLNPRSRMPHAILYRRFLMFLILTACALYVSQSFDGWIAQNVTAFEVMDGFVATAFLVDYALRISAAPERRKFRRHGALMARLRYVLSMGSVVDALATFPFFLDKIFSAWDLPQTTWLRIFRVFHLLNPESYAQSLHTCMRILWVNRTILGISATLCLLMLLFTSSLVWGMTSVEIKQQNNLKDLPSTAYLSLMMLTGQASLEGTLPWYLKGVVAFTAVLSVAFFAIPAAMLTWGFEGEAGRLAAREQRRWERKRAFAGVPHDVSAAIMSDSQSSSSDESERLEEYLETVAGEDAEDDEEDADTAFSFFCQVADGEVGSSLLAKAQEVASGIEDAKRRRLRAAEIRGDAVAVLLKARDIAARGGCADAEKLLRSFSDACKMVEGENAKAGEGSPSSLEAKVDALTQEVKTLKKLLGGVRG